MCLVKQHGIKAMCNAYDYIHYVNATRKKYKMKRSKHVAIQYLTKVSLLKWLITYYLILFI